MTPVIVMAALVAAIHVFLRGKKGVDGRNKSGHDGKDVVALNQPDTRGTRPGMTKECQRRLVLRMRKEFTGEMQKYVDDNSKS
jgi:hypothetical protein